MISKSGLPFKIRAPLHRLNKKNVNKNSDILSLSLRTEIYKYIKPTPLQNAISMSDNKTVLLKREDLNPTFSFYIRCALNQLINEKTKETVITSSVGSRGYCLAYASSLLGKKCKVFMQENVPKERIEMIKGMNAEVFLKGKNTNEATNFMKEYASQNDNVTIMGSHDNPHVLSGCGTIALELLKQNTNVDAIFVPVGGGSLVSGICYNIKSIFPNTRVYGVEYENQCTLYESLMKGYLIEKNDPGIYGISISKMPQKVFDICDQFLDDIVLVGREEIENSIISCFKDTRTVIEPHGVLSIAGMQRLKMKGRNVVCIVSDSGNICSFENIVNMYNF